MMLLEDVLPRYEDHLKFARIELRPLEGYIQFALSNPISDLLLILFGNPRPEHYAR